jgi:histidinol-phosphate aminotransferase
LKFKNKNSYLKNIKRLRIPENRDLENGLRLNRNEKVDIWPENYLNDIFNKKSDYFLSVYPDLSNLYNKISKHIGLDESKILVTSGIDGAMKTLWEIATVPGDSVGVPGPTYAMYYVYNKLFRTKLTEINYDLQSKKLNWSQLNKFLDLKPSIFFLPNPNQPIEDTISIDKLEDLAKKTSKNGTLFVVDEAYYYFGADTAMQLVDNYSNVVVMRTFSKGFGAPSIRLGYMVSNNDNMEYFSKTRFAHETSALSSTVAEYFLDNFYFIKNYNEKVIAAREEIKTRLTYEGIPCHGDKGNYLLINLGTKEKCLKITKILEHNLIYIKSNYSKPWESHILITVGPINKMEKFVSILIDSYKNN